MWIDGTKYYFKLGDKNAIILELKKFLDSRSYLKTLLSGIIFAKMRSEV